MLQLEEENKPKSKSYLRSSSTIPGFYQLGVEDITKLKLAAIRDLKKDLEATDGDFEKIYQIFLQVKTADKGILRYRSEHLLSDMYTDTNSYGEAIKDIFEAIPLYKYQQKGKSRGEKKGLDELLDLNSYPQYEQLSQMLQEAYRCGYYANEYMRFIAVIKPKALNFFITEVKQEETVAGVLHYYELAQIPNNILRIHTENWFSSEGKTESYKIALFNIAQQAMDLRQFDVAMDRPLLIKLHDELKTIKPFFDSDGKWTKLITDFTKYVTSNGEKPSTNISQGLNP